MKKRILHIIDNLESGGAQRRLLTDLRLIDSSRFDNKICYLFNINELEPQIRKLGLKTRCLNLRTPYDFGKGISGIHKLFGEFRPDLIHTQLFTSDVCARIVFSLNRKIPVVSTVQSSVYASTDPFFYSPLRRLLDSFTAHVSRCRFIAVSEFVKRVTCKFLGVNENMIEVIYNSIDAQHFNQCDQNRIAELKKELDLNADERIILSIGKLNPPKGYRYLVEAMKIVSTKAKLPCKVLIVGEGPEREFLEEKVVMSGLKGKILFLGKRAEVRELLELCDIFVFPTMSEGLPLVVLEAFASQKACISTDIEPLQEMIVSGIHGLLVKPGDANALAEAIIEILKNPSLSLKFAKNGYSRVKEKFEAYKAARQLEEFYEKILSLNN